MAKKVKRRKLKTPAGKARHGALVRRLMEGVNVPLLIVEPRGLKIEFANPAFEELSGLARRKLLNSNVREHFGDNTDVKIAAICELMTPAGRRKVEEHELTLVRHSGRKLSVNVVASPLVIEGKRLLLLSVHDLTYIKKLQAKRELNLQELAQISKLADIGMLAAGVAHELNNPLMIVLGFAENLESMVMSGTATTTDLVKQCHEIVKASERMGRIIRQMSRMVRSTEVEFHIADIRDVVQNVLHFINHEVKSVKVEIDFDVAAGCMVKCDSNQIEQVILNVISNALHAVDTLQGERKIRITCERSEWVDLKIWNNGPAIPKMIQEKIMTPFFTTKEVGKGTGLGLPVSFGIIKAHGGNLSFISNEMHGTTFQVRLPSVATEEQAS